MKYSLDRCVQEILQRSEVLAEKSRRRSLRALSVIAFALLAVLMVTMLQLEGPGGARAMPSPYGAFLISEATGGYVLTGVIAFALGIVVTMLCIRRRKPQPKHTQKSHNDDSEVTP